VKERHGGKVTVITMGPPQTEAALRDSIHRRGQGRPALLPGLCGGRHPRHQLYPFARNREARAGR
jgi:hypothetical protein